MSHQITFLSRCKVTLVAFVWFFSTVRFQMFTERAWVSAGKVTQDAFFCVRYQMVLKMPVCGEVKSHKAARQLLLLLQGKGNHLQNGVLLHLLHLTMSLQFGVVHNQVLFYVGHHQVLHMNLSCKHIHFHF